MLKRLQRHPLLANAAEVLVDAVRYVAILLVMIVLLGHAAGLAFSDGRDDQPRTRWTTMTALMRSSAPGVTGSSPTRC